MKCSEVISAMEGLAIGLKNGVDILKAQMNGDCVRVCRCMDCMYWEPETPEEGDCSGRCRNNYGPCQNQQTDMYWFCADGERRDGDE